MQIIINWVVQKQIANDTCWQMARLQVSSSIPLVDKFHATKNFENFCPKKFICLKSTEMQIIINWVVQKQIANDTC